MNGRRLALPGYRIRLTPSIFDLFSGPAQYPDQFICAPLWPKESKPHETPRRQVALAGFLHLPYIPLAAALAG